MKIVENENGLKMKIFVKNEKYFQGFSILTHFHIQWFSKKIMH